MTPARRGTEILHGHGGQVSDDEVQHQLRGLQLSHLTLAHKTDARNDEQIQDDGAGKGDDHGKTSREKIRLQYAAHRASIYILPIFLRGAADFLWSKQRF